MNTSNGEWTRCESCAYFDDCLNKENKDVCYFGNNDEADKTDMLEIINIEKYINALNNLLGVDNAYYAGDPDVDAIMEVIMLARKLENMVKKLTEENEYHRKTIAQTHREH